MAKMKLVELKYHWNCMMNKSYHEIKEIKIIEIPRWFLTSSIIQFPTNFQRPMNQILNRKSHSYTKNPKFPVTFLSSNQKFRNFTSKP
ncbi:hypothetical protein CARUB_v10021220mg [Capsella rubella]|uniref:Uncharacterized protein n=1 Tax=Capsella rubella TaxID=81985 RepID=R0ICR0_9BRAS|nr:hypothetical protein CARUB_v10021220mg [Capsella rubella]